MKILVIEFHSPNSCSHLQKERRVIFLLLDQLPGSITDEPEAVVLIDLGQDGAQTSFQFVGAGGRVNDQGVLSVAPRVVHH